MDIIKREEQRDKWQLINQATGDTQTRATNLMQQMEGDSVVDILEALAMSEEIQKVTEKQFDLAQRAPATSSSLRNLISHNVGTTFAKDLLQHKVSIPAGMNTTTVELIAASGHVYVCPMDQWRSHLPYTNIIGGGSMEQHPRLSLAFTLGTGRFFVSQANSSN
jgi:hypothetical protein